VQWKQKSHGTPEESKPQESAWIALLTQQAAGRIDVHNLRRRSNPLLFEVMEFAFLPACIRKYFTRRRVL
jgi:hypothetical protein